MNENNWIFSRPVLALLLFFSCGVLWYLFVQELPFWLAMWGGLGVVYELLSLVWELSDDKGDK